MQKLLKSAEIRRVCDPKVFAGIHKSGDISDKVIIGQNRAIKALKLGLNMKAHGFNIYVSGGTGTGKLTAITQFVELEAKKEPVPADWCYVNNFKDTYIPKTLSLPPVCAIKFKKDMKGLVRDMYRDLIKTFDGEDYANRKEKIVAEFETEQAKILGKISEDAEKDSFLVKQTKESIITIPLKDNKPLTDKQLKAMTEAEIDEINWKQDKLQEQLSAGLREIRQYEKIMNESLDKLAKDIALFAIGSLIDDVIERYKATPAVTNYLQALREDVMDNLPEFMKSQKSHAPVSTDNPFLRRYEVAVLVDNTDAKGAPVITERNPTYNNLLGRVEKESYLGTLMTDFTMIRKGALHTANGGYLIIRIEDLLQNYFSWDCLKRALKNREIVIEDATDQLGYLTSRTLKPEPIPLDIKVILIGSPLYYQALYEYDSDFRDLFKIKADFDSVMMYTPENLSDYSAYVQAICAKEKLLHADNKAVARIIEYSSHLMGLHRKASYRCQGKGHDV